jgi:excisionase family DNA binding protein
MKLYDIQDVARMLAVSPWTVRAYIRNGKLRPIRIGRLVRLDEQELERFVAGAKGSGHSGRNQEPEDESLRTTRMGRNDKAGGFTAD